MFRIALLIVLAATAYHGLVVWGPRSGAYPPLTGWLLATSDSYPQVVFLIVAALLFRRRRELREALGGARSPGLGMLCLAASVAFHLWAQWVDAADFMVVSLGLFVLGLGLVLGGRPLARELAAPLGLLAFAIPIPGAFLNFIVYPVQLASAGFTGAALRALGFDVVQHADLLSLDDRGLAVIETCSGLRSIQTLTLLACAWVVFFRCSPRHTAWLLAISPVIAFLTNGLRLMMLVLDPRPEIQESHTAQGIAVFVVGSVALSLVDRALLRLGVAEAKAPPAAEQPAARAAERRRLASIALPLLVMAAAALWLPALRPSAPVLEPPPKLPRELAGWSAQEGPDTGHFLGNVHFTQRSNLAYERDGQSIAAFLGSDDRKLRTRSLLSEKNAVPGSGWEIEQRGQMVFEPGPVRMEFVVARRFDERMLTVHAYRDTAGFLVESLREALALDQPGSPFARNGRARMLRLSTPVARPPDDLREAEERLRRFYAELAPGLAW